LDHMASLLSRPAEEFLPDLKGMIFLNPLTKDVYKRQFQDKAFTEAFPFTLRLRLIRNPNMALNGRFPTAVGDFKYEINR